MISTHVDRPYEVATRMEGGRRVIAYRATCPQCQATDDIRMKPDTPPDVIMAAFRRRGWLVHKRRTRDWLCPTCNSHPTSEKTKTMSQTRESVSDQTIHQAGMIVRKLHEVFDETKGRYTDGCSDHSVAEQLNLPRKMVETVRLAIGFEIKEDPEIAQLRADLAAAEQLLADLKARIEKKAAR